MSGWGSVGKWLIGCLFCISTLGAQTRLLTVSDINPIMGRFLKYHVENHELSPLIIKRSFKIYIESFDPGKIYLLKSEVKSYLEMTDGQAKKIMARILAGDYSDYDKLNGVLQQAISRGREMRSELEGNFAGGEYDVTGKIKAQNYADYSASQNELASRQLELLQRFVHFHHKHSDLSSAERMIKALGLYEKRVRGHEKNYIYIKMSGKPFNSIKEENALSLHILKAFAKSLDAHTSFFTDEEALQMRISLEKQFEGIGVMLTETIDGVMIADLIKGSPAEISQKIKKGDILVEIDGKSVENQSFDKVLKAMKAKSRGEILLGMMRRESQNGLSLTYFQVLLKTQPIDMADQRLTYSAEPCEGGIIGRLVLPSFYENGGGINSERDIRKAIYELRKLGEIKGIVLDLRENSGGFLSQAVKVAGIFMSSGVVVMSKFSNNEVQYLRTLDVKALYNGPMIVLTSKLSASAAEIVAQALQDYGTALIVGDTRTFGKGSIQYQTITDKKADLFYKVTIGRYYTVSGRSTQIEGVQADIVVPSVYAAFKIGERFLEYPLSADRIKPAYTDPLSDLDPKTRLLFEKHYLPHLQRSVTFWKKKLPALKANSSYRMAHDPALKSYIDRCNQTDGKTKFKWKSIQSLQTGGDLQMGEAINILKDMINFQKKLSNS